MGRSVSTHRQSVCTVYLHLELDNEDDCAWTDFIEDLRANVLQQKFPSLRECDRWLDREDHIILENSQVEVSVSEYCGLVSVCLSPLASRLSPLASRLSPLASRLSPLASRLSPLDNGNGFHCAIAERLAASFQKCLHKAFPQSALRSCGHMSNGEQVFERTT